MDAEFQNRVEHFTILKSKYHASSYNESSPSCLLYLILRKVEIGIQVTQFELNWLKEQELLETLEVVSEREIQRETEIKRLEKEFSLLKSQYKVPNFRQGIQDDIAVTLYPILWKHYSEGQITNSEVEWLKTNQLSGTIKAMEEIALQRQFIALKQKYKATKYQDASPYGRLHTILKKLDTKTRLSNSEYKSLINLELFETIEIFKQQEAEREAVFLQLKEKYQATKCTDISVSSPLYSILQKLEGEQPLISSEIDWLQQQGLKETIAIVEEWEQTREFANLKVKYKATQHQDFSPTSHMYKVLKSIELNMRLREEDVNFLKKQKLDDTIAIAYDKYALILKSKIESGENLSESEIDLLKKHQGDDIINFAKQKHFEVLKRKYGIVDPGNKLPLEPLYTIMLKLEKKERLDPLFVIQLIEEDILSSSGKITLAHYRLEAEFYEEEFKRTGHQWHIPNASSYWRKANEPKRVLELTKLDLSRIRENKLKSAILVTRGAAFRDMDNLGNAESCAKEAMKYYPESYQPYTLMGAIFYEKGDYQEGDCWFREAIKRGAKTDNIDDEIKRVIRSTKDEHNRQIAVEFLLKKDPKRYTWANFYLKKSTDNSKSKK